MNKFDWIALIGAFSWLPHIFKYLKDYFSKSQIKIITNKICEIGFTNYGSILNIRIAFVVQNKDIVITNINLKVKHENGEEKLFSWYGLTQNMLEMQDPNSGVIPFNKESTVLAIKLNIKDVEERSIRFQEPSFHERNTDLILSADKKQNYLKQNKIYEANDFIKSTEINDLVTYVKQSFSWKPGKYTLEFKLESDEDFDLLESVYMFELSNMDIELLEKNKNIISDLYSNLILNNGSTDDHFWHWAYPSIKKMISN